MSDAPSSGPQVWRWRRVLAAEKAANERTLAGLRSVPGSEHGSEAFRRACGRMAHNQMARHVWLARIGFIEHRPWEMFPAWSIDQIAADAARLDRDWSGYLDTLDDAGLAAEVDYTSTDGVRWRSTVDEILTHVHNHSTYHRGQIAMLIKQCGGAPQPTDYIALTRRPAGGGV